MEIDHYDGNCTEPTTGFANVVILPTATESNDWDNMQVTVNPCLGK